MTDKQPVTATTVRPIRLLGAIAASAALIVVGTFLVVEGGHRYRLWQADGVWCVTVEPGDTISMSYGVEVCGY
jgi:hypothetical protein